MLIEEKCMMNVITDGRTSVAVALRLERPSNPTGAYSGLFFYNGCKLFN